MTKLYPLLLIYFLSLQVNSQDINREVTENTKTPYLLGKINKSGLEGENYSSWFSLNYNDYNPNPKLIAELTKPIKEFSIKLFMGTWCGDSKILVPKLYKILEYCQFPMEQLTVIALSREPQLYKQSPEHEEEGLNVHRVPTLIFYKNSKEVNRIVEYPIESLEDDILNIVTVNDYEPNYKVVSAVHNILSQKGILELKRKQNELVKLYKEDIQNIYELNTYGRVLYSTGHVDEAIEVFELNTKFYPNEARPYMSLANTLGILGEKEKAIATLKTAIEVLPENKDLKENLITIENY